MNNPMRLLSLTCLALILATCQPDHVTQRPYDYWQLVQYENACNYYGGHWEALEARIRYDMGG